MKFILVIERKHLFPGLSPQGVLPADAIDRALLERHAFFAERGFMEQCSHYKQIIPYIVLRRGDRVLAYQRKAKHSETRLGGLWTVGFGGHVEPIDRTSPEVREIGVLELAAIRELHEETGLEVDPTSLAVRGYINSEENEVSSVHLGLLFEVDLSGDPRDEAALAALVTAQSEPHRVEWVSVADLRGPDGAVGPAPHDGAWEDWTLHAIPTLV